MRGNAVMKVTMYRIPNCLCEQRLSKAHRRLQEQQQQQRQVWAQNRSCQDRGRGGWMCLACLHARMHACQGKSQARPCRLHSRLLHWGLLASALAAPIPVCPSTRPWCIVRKTAKGGSMTPFSHPIQKATEVWEEGGGGEGRKGGREGRSCDSDPHFVPWKLKPLTGQLKGAEWSTMASFFLNVALSKRMHVKEETGLRATLHVSSPAPKPCLERVGSRKVLGGGAGVLF